MEENLHYFNYFDAAANPAYQDFLNDLDARWVGENEEKRAKRKQKVLRRLLSATDRGYIVQKIFDLHDKKQYRSETVFTAMNILDRYLAQIGFWVFPRNQACLLATTSILVAAKIEEKFAPSFEYMLTFLTEEERQIVNREELLELEADILVTLGFDLCFPGPVAPMERFLRLLQIDHLPILHRMSFQICKFAYNESTFLQYPPTQIAACAVLIC